MADLLALSAHLPEVRVGPGDALVTEGGPSGEAWVLVSGALRVLKGAVQVATIATPGALVGEISVLTGMRHTATVEAIEPTVLRHATDGHAFLSGDPAIISLVAVGLAERLAFVTTYLADLQHQYGDAPGLAMVSDVLGQLSQRQSPTARPGSMRDPDPEY